MVSPSTLSRYLGLQALAKKPAGKLRGSSPFQARIKLGVDKIRGVTRRASYYIHSGTGHLLRQVSNVPQVSQHQRTFLADRRERRVGYLELVETEDERLESPAGHRAWLRAL